MAGDWIKFRGDLFTHPKFIALGTMLMHVDEISHGIKGYITEDGNGSVTQRALRDVTLAALLRVWCAANAHGKPSGNDVVMPLLTGPELDEIAGFDGFSDALKKVGWIELIEDCNGVIFKNFLRFNEPSSVRPPARSNAERQKAFRERKKAAAEGVTPVTKSNGEKRREELKPKSSPSPSVPDRFEEFWKMYPRGVAKADARKAWLKAVKRDPAVADAIIEGLRKYKFNTDEGGKYIPHAATWLNGRRWEDVEATVAAPAAPLFDYLRRGEVI